MLQNFIDILAAPREVFTRLQERPTWLIPLVLLIIAVCAVNWSYFHINDPEFIREQMIEQALAANPDVPQAAQEQMEKTLEGISLDRLQTISIMGTTLVVAILSLCYAGYLVLANKVAAKRFGYQQWLALTCWTTVPSALGAVASLVILWTDGSREVSQADLNVFGLTTLLGIETDSQLLQQFSLLQLWSLALAAMGFKQWTDSDWLTSIGMTSAPYVLIYGGIALATL